MLNKKKSVSQDNDQERSGEQVQCLTCGRYVQPGACSWEDEQGPFCRDCRAELDGCGCSD